MFTGPNVAAKVFALANSRPVENSPSEVSPPNLWKVRPKVKIGLRLLALDPREYSPSF